MSRTSLAFWAVVASTLMAPASGCGSDDASGGGGGSGPYQPPGNGVPIGESEACNALLNAEDQAYLKLACGPVTRPPCPSFIQVGGHAACSQYDQGTVQGCVEYIASHASCDALKTKKCAVASLPGSAPNGCPVVDSGPDAPADTGVDAPPDVGSDVTDDAEPDTGADAPGDVTTDAPSEASAD